MKRCFTPLRAAVIAALTAFLLLGPAQAAPPRVTLTMWCSPYAAEAGWAIQMVNLWNRKHLDVQVRLQKMPSERVAEDVLRDAIRDHKTPDVCAHMFPANVHEFVKMGGLLPLDGQTSLMAASAKRSGANEMFRSADGKLYQIPWKCNPIMLQYNRSMLDGTRPPRTYGELLALGERLRKRGILVWAPVPVDRWYARYYDFYPLYLAASGGKGFIDAAGRPALDQAAAIAVLDLLAETFKRGFAPTKELYRDPAAQNEAFASGKLAILVTGPWNVQMITELAGNTIQFGFTPLVVPNSTDPTKPVMTYGNFRNISIFSTCQHPAEAAALVEFLISPPSDAAFLDATSELPYRPGLLTDATFRVHLQRRPHLLAFARQLPWVRPIDNTPHFNRILGILSRQLVDVAVKGTRSAPAAVRDAVDEMTQILGER